VRPPQSKSNASLITSSASRNQWAAERDRVDEILVKEMAYAVHVVVLEDPRKLANDMLILVFLMHRQFFLAVDHRASKP
jgi:hypothetical protein